LRQYLCAGLCRAPQKCYFLPTPFFPAAWPCSKRSVRILKIHPLRACPAGSVRAVPPSAWLWGAAAYVNRRNRNKTRTWVDGARLMWLHRWNEGGCYFNCTNQNAGLFELSTRSITTVT
jgi:hypothetical protein